ncbi:MAG: elongation factor G [Clostridia bacterium]|nr:elongation factor G [Clostridia bacterium]
MAKFSGDNIRNIVLLGHGGSGKTSLAEALLHIAGASDRFGKVTEGTTVTDYDPEEIKRKFSINSAVAPFEWKTEKIGLTKVNIIDTPGYFDFVGDALGGVRVADSALITVSGKSGVQVGTEYAWQYASDKGIPKMFFVNNMDDENADFGAVMKGLKDSFGTSVAAFRVPIKEGGKLTGYINVVSGKAYKVDGDKETEISIPDAMKDEYDSYHDSLVEAAAESDDELLEKYFEGAEITDEEMRRALKSGVKTGKVSPVYGGSAVTLFAVRSIMDAMLKYLPSPVEAAGEAGCDANGSTAAFVFKTVADPFVGKLSIFRVYRGTLKPDSTVINARTGENERIGKVYTLRGKKQTETDGVAAGDIGAVTKLATTVTGDTLCTGEKTELDGIAFPRPNISMAIVAKVKGDEEKISSGLVKLMEEDPTFRIDNNKETHQMVISGVGEQHLDVISSKLKSKFGVSVELTEAKVPYRETIRKSVKVQGRHKKQSGGHGQFGDVWIEFSPHDGEDLLFEEKIFGGAVPKNFFPAVEKGLRECVVKGVLAGYPVVGLKAVLTDGSYHPVDSSEMAFKIAASLAYKEGLKQASPVLLEPIGKLEVIVPSANMGDVMGDVNKRRGRVLEMGEIGGGKARVCAEVPMSEMGKYATDLRSMTKARGSFTLEFVRYEEAPANVAQKVIEQAKAENAE